MDKIEDCQMAFGVSQVTFVTSASSHMPGLACGPQVLQRIDAVRIMS